jgi:hypothetical protein
VIEKIDMTDENLVVNKLVEVFDAK